MTYSFQGLESPPWCNPTLVMVTFSQAKSAMSFTSSLMRRRKLVVPLPPGAAVPVLVTEFAPGELATHPPRTTTITDSMTARTRTIFFMLLPSSTVCRLCGEAVANIYNAGTGEVSGAGAHLYHQPSLL